jgi:hypothetical protein
MHGDNVEPADLLQAVKMIFQGLFLYLLHFYW